MTLNAFGQKEIFLTKLRKVYLWVAKHFVKKMHLLRIMKLNKTCFYLDFFVYIFLMWVGNKMPERFVH